VKPREIAPLQCDGLFVLPGEHGDPKGSYFTANSRVRREIGPDWTKLSTDQARSMEKAADKLMSAIQSRPAPEIRANPQFDQLLGMMNVYVKAKFQDSSPVRNTQNIQESEESVESTDVRLLNDKPLLNNGSSRTTWSMQRRLTTVTLFSQHSRSLGFAMFEPLVDLLSHVICKTR